MCVTVNSFRVSVQDGESRNLVKRSTVHIHVVLTL